MKLRYKILIWCVLVLVLGNTAACVYLNTRRVYPGMPTQISKTYFRPVAIMGIDFGENVSDDFRPGQHYVLKVFYVKDAEVGFGFCRVDYDAVP